MSARDITVIKNPGDVLTFQVDDRTTTGYANVFEPGEPLCVKAASSVYAQTVPNGGPIRGSDDFLGICAKQSTETATANGTVDYISMLPGTMLRGKATTSTNVNTAAKILAYQQGFVGFDNTSEVFTIDEDESDDPNKLALQIITGDYMAYTLDVMVNINNCYGGWYGQTID